MHCQASFFSEFSLKIKNYFKVSSTVVVIRTLRVITFVLVLVGISSLRQLQ